MAEVKKSRVYISVGSTGSTVEYKKAYYSGTNAAWQICGDGLADDPGTAVTITMTEIGASGIESGYYDYGGDIITSGNYTLYVNGSPITIRTGVPLFGMDLMQYVADNYAHTQATSGVHGATGNVVGTTDAQTLTNKTLTTPVIPSIYQDAGKTKLMSLPAVSSDTIATLAATQTFTNKTLTTPLIASLYQDSIGGSNLLTMPAATDTLIGKATTDNLTNKSLADATTYFYDTDGVTRKFKFDCENITAGNTRVFKTSDTNDTIAVSDNLITASDVVTSLASGTSDSISVLRYIVAQLLSSGKFADMMAYAGFVISGAGVPSSTPVRVGQIYVDTTNDEAYISTDTASSADWDQIS